MKIREMLERTQESYDLEWMSKASQLISNPVWEVGGFVKIPSTWLSKREELYTRLGKDEVLSANQLHLAVEGAMLDDWEVLRGDVVDLLRVCFPFVIRRRDYGVVPDEKVQHTYDLDAHDIPFKLSLKAPYQSRRKDWLGFSFRIGLTAEQESKISTKSLSTHYTCIRTFLEMNETLVRIFINGGEVL